MQQEPVNNNDSDRQCDSVTASKAFGFASTEYLFFSNNFLGPNEEKLLITDSIPKF
jgi:hypothetical protein